MGCSYTVSHAHIATIVEYAGEVLCMRTSESPEGATARLADALAAANTASVNHRYDEQGKPLRFWNDDDVAELARRDWFEPLSILRAVRTMEEQSRDHPEWPGSLACDFLNEVRRRTVTRLPGFDAGPDHVDGDGVPPGMQARLRGQNFGVRMAAALEARDIASKVRH